MVVCVEGGVLVSVCMRVMIVCSGIDVLVSIVIDIISIYIVTESVLYLYYAPRANSEVISCHVFIHTRSVEAVSFLAKGSLRLGFSRG